MRLGWVTDIHLDYLDQPQDLTDFTASLVSEAIDSLLVTGDIANAPELDESLEKLAEGIGRPVYFVLGNHDFYGGSIADVRSRMVKLCRRNPRLFWLPAEGVVAIGPGTGLIGHEGWADGGYGDYANSPVLLNE